MRRCRARRRWRDDPTLICGHEVADVVVGEIVDGHPVVPPLSAVRARYASGPVNNPL